MKLTESLLDDLTHLVNQQVESAGLTLDVDLMTDLNQTLSNFFEDKCGFEIIGENLNIAQPHHNPYSVISLYEETGQITTDHIKACSAGDAFVQVAKERPEALIITAICGHLNEGREAFYPGMGAVDAETIIAQRGTFLNDIPAFSELDVEAFVDWLTLARQEALKNGTPIDEEDSAEAERQAEVLYDQYRGMLPLRPAQAVADEMSQDLDFRLQPNETKIIRVHLAALTRVDYSEDVVVPIEFDKFLLQDLVDRSFSEMDGSEFSDDPSYFQKSEACRYEVLKSNTLTDSQL